MMETKWLFKCPECKSVMALITNLEDEKINQKPECPCGSSTMVNMNSEEYAYGNF